MLIKINDLVLETEEFISFWLNQKTITFSPKNGGTDVSINYDSAIKARDVFDKIVKLSEPLIIDK